MNRPMFALSALAIALSACTTAAPRNDALEVARTRLVAAQADAAVGTLAREEVDRAAVALRTAENARKSGARRDEIDHLAALTEQRIDIARETAAGRKAQAVTAAAAGTRDKVRLEQRTQEADAALVKLALAEQDGARKGAELAMSEQDRARKATDLANAERSARDSKAQAARGETRLEDLERQYRALDARKTERGVVVTLGDTLFASGRASLQSDAVRSLSRLADFMKRNPERSAVVEGHTDNTGSEAANYDLSDRRARAVVASLVRRGIGPERLDARSFGEGQPVADNDTVSGRRLNRRVDVVFSDEAVVPVVRQ